MKGATGTSRTKSTFAPPQGVSPKSTSPSTLLAPPGAAQAREPKETGVKIDWHQTDKDVIATFYARGVKQSEVAFGCDETSFKLTIKSDAITRSMKGGNFFSATFTLDKEIVKEESQVKLHLTKIEVTLRKKEEGVRWELSKLEKTSETSTRLDSVTTSMGLLLLFILVLFLCLSFRAIL